MKKNIVLETTDFCYHTPDLDVYHIWNHRIRIFQKVKEFISENTCLQVSKIETKSILLPRYPIYRDGVYCGIATKWKTGDWISSFGYNERFLKQSLMKMKEEILYLSHLGYDLVDMPFYCSFSNGRDLTFDGAYHLRESSLTEEALEKKNNDLFDGYLCDLIYNAMSEFGMESDVVITYLCEMEGTSYENLLSILKEGKPAGYRIKEDIEEKVLGL